MIERRLPRPRRAIAVLAAVAIACGGAAVSSSALAADKIVKIGIIAGVTGKGSSDAQEMVRGAQMAVDEANAQGGVAGYKFELVVGDVKEGAAGDVTNTVERLQSDPDMHFMLTGYASITNFELDAMADAGMPYMLDGGADQTREIISPNPDRYWCCWSFTPSFDAYSTAVLPLFEKLAKDGKIKLPNRTLAMVSSDNAYSKGISEGLKKKFAAAGWKIVVDEMVPFGEVNDWGAILAKIRQNPPDLIVNTDYLPANSASFLQQFMQQPTNSFMFLQYAPSVPEFTKLTGSKSNGVLYDLFGTLETPKVERAKQIEDAFKKKYNVETGTEGVSTYEEVWSYFDALKKVGDPTKHKEIGLAMVPANA